MTVCNVLRLMTIRYLAFIGVTKERNFDQGKSLIDYNIQVLQDSLLKVFARQTEN